ncbi:dihydrofolate reductase family protein [Amaricoccus tamworthensis]|uniref:dihydrofolate reductase family protein n=1 Tax=Amaricoccus tamworthensis TaxID=57002 RepID=UPI003C7C3851
MTDLTTGHVFIAMSLDGFIARTDGSINWLLRQDTGEEDHGFDAFISGMDGLVMGSGTFRSVQEFDPWPYKVPVVVMSASMTVDDIPERLRGGVEISGERPEALMERLKSRGWKRAYVDGGQVIQSFLRAGLIVDMTVTVIPILIGEGRGLFGAVDRDIDLELTDVKSFPSGLVSNTYRVITA